MKVLLADATVTRYGSLGAESMPDSNYFIRWLIENSSSEIVGLGLAIIYYSHLHFAILYSSAHILRLETHS